MIRRGRRSPREHKIAVNAAFDLYGPALDQFKTEIAPKRIQRAQGSDGRPLERNVLKAVIKALRGDPRVSRVERNQSGMFQDGDRIISVGARGKLDLTIYLRSGRYMELEVKRDGKTQPSGEQRARITKIKAAGGLADWCWSVESALAVLPS